MFFIVHQKENSVRIWISLFLLFVIQNLKMIFFCVVTLVFISWIPALHLDFVFITKKLWFFFFSSRFDFSVDLLAVNISVCCHLVIYCSKKKENLSRLSFFFVVSFCSHWKWNRCAKFLHHSSLIKCNCTFNLHDIAASGFSHAWNWFFKLNLNHNVHHHHHI